MEECNRYGGEIQYVLLRHQGEDDTWSVSVLFWGANTSIRPLSLYLHRKQTNLQNDCVIWEKHLEDGELSFLKLSRPSPTFSMIKTQTLMSDDGLRRSSGAHSKEKKRETSASIRLVSNLSVLFSRWKFSPANTGGKMTGKKPGVFGFS